mmetsp:Transcript_21857/g.45625  ORF Transcript_21857/g.45625 Transcript_21857/m.45625 type:complete len:214 (-) Transcript_21857:342-983(-)
MLVSSTSPQLVFHQRRRLRLGHFAGPPGPRSTGLLQLKGGHFLRRFAKAGALDELCGPGAIWTRIFLKQPIQQVPFQTENGEVIVVMIVRIQLRQLFSGFRQVLARAGPHARRHGALRRFLMKDGQDTPPSRGLRDEGPGFHVDQIVFDLIQFVGRVPELIMSGCVITVVLLPIQKGIHRVYQRFGGKVNVSCRRCGWGGCDKSNRWPIRCCF